MIEKGYTSMTVYLDDEAYVCVSPTPVDGDYGITVYHPHGTISLWVPATDEATQHMGAELVRVGLELQQARVPAEIA